MIGYEVNVRIQFFRYLLMTAEFTAVIRGNSANVATIPPKHSDHSAAYINRTFSGHFTY
jgi:hypothetical protein